MLFLNFILYLIGSSKYIVVLTRNGLNRILCYIQFPFKFFFFPITSTIKKKNTSQFIALLNKIKAKKHNFTDYQKTPALLYTNLASKKEKRGKGGGGKERDQ